MSAQPYFVLAEPKGLSVGNLKQNALENGRRSPPGEKLACLGQTPADAPFKFRVMEHWGQPPGAGVIVKRETDREASGGPGLALTAPQALLGPLGSGWQAASHGLPSSSATMAGLCPGILGPPSSVFISQRRHKAWATVTWRGSKGR